MINHFQVLKNFNRSIMQFQPQAILLYFVTFAITGLMSYFQLITIQEENQTLYNHYNKLNNLLTTNAYATQNGNQIESTLSIQITLLLQLYQLTTNFSFPIKLLINQNIFYALDDHILIPQSDSYTIMNLDSLQKQILSNTNRLQSFLKVYNYVGSIDYFIIKSENLIIVYPKTLSLAQIDIINAQLQTEYDSELFAIDQYICLNQQPIICISYQNTINQLYITTNNNDYIKKDSYIYTNNQELQNKSISQGYNFIYFQNIQNLFKYILIANFVDYRDYLLFNNDMYIQYLLPFVILIPIFGGLLIGYFSNSFANAITTSINQQIQLMQQAGEFDYYQINDNYYGYELKEFSLKLEKLILFLQICSDNFYTGDDTTLLIRYAQALNNFRNSNNNQILGILHNNIGNMYFKIQDYNSAIDSYQSAVDCCIKELQLVFENRDISLFYKFEIDQSEDDVQLVLQNQTNKKVWVDLKRKQQLDQKLCNRSLQLANAKIQLANSNQDRSPETWSQIVNLLDTVVNVEPTLFKPNCKEINTLIKLADAYLIMKNYPLASTTLDYAETALEEYQEIYKLFLESNNRDDPPQILRQRTYLIRGRILRNLYKEGIVAFKKPVTLFTKALQCGNVYDQYVREQSLVELQELFDEKQMIPQLKFINKLIKDQIQKSKDLLILVDISNQMNENLMEQCQNRIFQVLQQSTAQHSRVGILVFNDIIEKLLILQNYETNAEFIIKTISKLQHQTFNGGACLLNCIYEATECFKQAVQTENKRLILLFTTGIENQSIIDYLTLADILRKEEIDILIVGISLDKERKIIMKSFADQINDSRYIDLENAQSYGVLVSANTSRLIDKDQHLVFETFN